MRRAGTDLASRHTRAESALGLAAGSWLPGRACCCCSVQGSSGANSPESYARRQGCQSFGAMPPSCFANMNLRWRADSRRRNTCHRLCLSCCCHGRSCWSLCFGLVRPIRGLLGSGVLGIVRSTRLQHCLVSDRWLFGSDAHSRCSNACYLHSRGPDCKFLRQLLHFRLALLCGRYHLRTLLRLLCDITSAQCMKKALLSSRANVTGAGR